MNNTKDSKKRNRRNMKVITWMLAAITSIIWLLLLFVKFIVTGVDLASLFDDILGNILGILPPIIIFNFAYEYLSKDCVADEMSEQMLETLTGNTEMMDTFREDVKKSFIKSTIRSIVGENREDMVYGVLERYIGETPYNMRSYFKYHIHLSDFYKNPKSEESCIFDPDEYYLLSEKLSYKKILSKSMASSNMVRVGFFVDNNQLEQELKGQDFLFRESLKINPRELKKICKLSQERKMALVTECFQLQLYINGEQAAIDTVKIDESGINVLMTSSTYDLERNTLEVTIGFKLPQIKKRSEFLVSITEPTFAPEIIFTYQPEKTMVTAYQFLNNDSLLFKDAESIYGNIEINPQGWIYPVKGVVFIIEDKNGLIENTVSDNVIDKMNQQNDSLVVN